MKEYQVKFFQIRSTCLLFAHSYPRRSSAAGFSILLCTTRVLVLYEHVLLVSTSSLINKEILHLLCVVLETPSRMPLH